MKSEMPRLGGEAREPQTGGAALRIARVTLRAPIVTRSETAPGAVVLEADERPGAPAGSDHPARHVLRSERKRAPPRLHQAAAHEHLDAGPRRQLAAPVAVH